MKRTGTILILALALTASANTLAAETAYVTDNLSITLRAGESTSHQVIRSLKSGVRLTITERHEETGYAHVTLEDGTQGWVLTRLLSSTPGAQQQLREAQNSLKKAREELKDAQEKLTTTSGAHRSADQTLQQLQQDNEKLTNALKELRAISGGALTLDEENKTLKTNKMQLETEVDALKQQNTTLEDSSNRNWFITGTGVMLLGLLIGLVIPGLRWRKKSSWNEL